MTSFEPPPPSRLKQAAIDFSSHQSFKNNSSDVSRLCLFSLSIPMGLKGVSGSYFPAIGWPCFMIELIFGPDPGRTK